MSHLVTIKTDVRDPVAITAACVRQEQQFHQQT